MINNKNTSRSIRSRLDTLEDKIARNVAFAPSVVKGLPPIWSQIEKLELLNTIISRRLVKKVKIIPFLN